MKKQKSLVYKRQKASYFIAEIPVLGGDKLEPPPQTIQEILEKLSFLLKTTI